MTFISENREIGPRIARMPRRVARGLGGLSSACVGGTDAEVMHGDSGTRPTPVLWSLATFPRSDPEIPRPVAVGCGPLRREEAANGRCVPRRGNGADPHPGRGRARARAALLLGCTRRRALPRIRRYFACAAV